MRKEEARTLAGRLAGLADESRRADRAVVKRARTGHPDQRLLARRVYHALIPPGMSHTPWNVELVERVAGLFVVNPAHVPDGPPLGAATRTLALRPHVSEAAVERRFEAILTAGPETLDIRIARLLAQMEREGIGIDYAQLVIDLDAAGHPDRYVQRRWADQCWGAPWGEQTTEPTEAAT
jgi:CRISPR type I-E-associated protein CasB/Cse2